MKFFQLTLALFSVLGLANCASTPATRAEKRPAAFQSVPASQKPTVLAGKITEGMNRDAVWIAWGPASSISQASEHGKHYEIWRYTGLKPIYRTHLGMGYATYPHGSGCNRHYHTDPFYNFDYGPDYIPFTAAVVRFHEGNVIAWERVTE